ncbi:poly alpha-glucosyltransferase [Acinetobacter sp. Tr-809]|uniref:poly alpha-glucosyltransferase n=1 Tax=Acinetobacter sp. Tr-809 TaxID=2608324 RepID=UPI00141DAFE8|nr:poly alpha-glucosyltransferase [Acinetobacter sp. Tr-809]NIE97987.1 poly alpha-glucosyltransferase [Acinetobacter sp. Tr-809]
MSITTISAYEQLANQLSEQFFKQLQPHIDVSKSVVFCSYGEQTQRCQVWNSSCSYFDDIQQQLVDFLEHQFAITEKLPTFLKFDVAFNIQQENWQDIEQTLKNQFHNNHYRKGMSFDADFNICFLEQELYGKAIIRALSYNTPNFVDEKNLNNGLLRKYPNQQRSIKIADLQQLWTFDTLAVIYEDRQLIPLHSQFTENGMRYQLEPKKQHFKKMIEANAKFLYQHIQSDGRFAYGFFPAYDREIRSYNTVRHCTSVYALLETLAIQSHQACIEKIQSAIDYALQHFYIEKQTELAYMLDGNEATGLDEIKLGANAAAILMLSKYQEMTGDNRYLAYAQRLANGILSMVNETGETTHVLHYPSYEIKEKFRIIYYDGEAALALLRFYQLHTDEKLLQTVKQMFERFITQKYDRYHDHWLSYCTNELTKICPEEKYFQFGLNNYLKHMVFIRNRKTAYATLLEMMMAAYQMVVRIRALGLDQLFEKAHFDDLKKLIEFRAEFQRTGFFYPEVAMYMARPDKVLNAFYVRHDRFRVRIDDQEHNLSGYVAYVQHFENEA